MADRLPRELKPEVTRRVVLRGAAVSTVALPLLAACGDATGTSDQPTTSPTQNGGGGGGAPTTLASTSDVPVGGGEILEDEKIVLTQPAEGDFKAFTAVCTHQQCLVTTIADGIINCPCHGSQYSILDGSVVGGPAPAPLAPIEITVAGDKVTRA